MAIKVFADGANLEGMLDMYENGNVQASQPTRPL